MVECPTCGTYKCDSFVADGDLIRTDTLDSMSPDPDKLVEVPRHVLSGLTREAWRRGEMLTITRWSLDDLLHSASIPDGPLEAMDRVLLYVERQSPSADAYNTIPDQDYPIAFAKHPREFRYLLSCIVQRNYLEQQEMSSNYRLTPEGWARVAELRATQRDSDQAFVAMWFDPQLDTIWEQGLKPALEETGYRPIRIDLVEHNEICDRIVSEIRRSGLLIADFTGNRGGVYFEAGYAMGLGIPVIWTCAEAEIDSVHFDTRQYNHITWESAEDLKRQLADRIQATLPIRTRKRSATPARP